MNELEQALVGDSYPMECAPIKTLACAKPPAIENVPVTAERTSGTMQFHGFRVRGVGTTQCRRGAPKGQGQVGRLRPLR
jgi:hypothetical protein